MAVSHGTTNSSSRRTHHEHDYYYGSWLFHTSVYCVVWTDIMIRIDVVANKIISKQKISRQIFPLVTKKK